MIKKKFVYGAKFIKRKKMSEKLVYIGKIIELADILNADFIQNATVVCGAGGKWRGIVRKGQYSLGDTCVVFLPDAVIPPREDMQFMEKSKWRVKMQRFRGVPSEVVIIPIPSASYLHCIGEDVTERYNVTKYVKPVPANLQGKVIGEFPGFIPKTDEPNWQRVPEMVEELRGKSYYITQKCDGSSTTAFKYKGNFGLCSRNWELEPSESNGYWKIARKYDLENRLPEGIAVQFETCGPKIQNNPMRLTEIDGFCFSGYNIPEHRYLTAHELEELLSLLKMPWAKVLDFGISFSPLGDLTELGKGKYDNGKDHEGVVVRSTENVDNGKPISFKIINLDYKD